jgi:hypothetical protein
MTVGDIWNSCLRYITFAAIVPCFHRLTPGMLKMKKLLSMLAVAAFSLASVGAFAGSHGGAMSDKEKAELTEKCAKMDPAKADDKMKADCKKLKEMKK